MASGTSYEFSIPKFKPVHMLDDGSSDIGNTNPRYNNLSKQTCLQRRNVAHPATIPQSIMLGSLLERLCSVYEHEPNKANQLFRVICKQLESMKIISPVAYAEEYASVRFQYKKALYALMQSSFSSLAPELPLHSSRAAVAKQRKTRADKENIFNLHASRYLEEYEEIGHVGRGAYGSVFKARNKMDGQVYAVKKIRMKDNSVLDENPCIERIMREVQSLAETDSSRSGGPAAISDSFGPKSFGFNNEMSSSWGGLSFHAPLSESSERNAGKFWKVGSSEESSDRSGCSSSSDCSEVAGGEVKEEADVHRYASGDCDDAPEVIRTQGVLKGQMRRVQSVILTSQRQISLAQSWAQSRSRGQSYSNMQDLALLERQFAPVTPCYELPRDEMVLYIQMQLCQTSLAKWLVDRNSREPTGGSDPCSIVDEVSSLDIMRQVLQALDHIHSHGVMHRDVKPRNILLNGARPNIMLGDFGLARTALTRQHSMQECAGADVEAFFANEQTSGVGTMIYAAPEQIAGAQYDFKADLYAVGIVLYELLWPIKTQHERVQMISELRKESVPSQFTQHWPSKADTLKALLSHEPAARPTARQLLDRNALKVNNTEVIVEQREEISKLKAEVARLQQLNKFYVAKLVENGVKID